MIQFDLSSSSYSQTKQEILSGAFRALRKASYSAVAISDIGKEQQQSTGLIYYHFDDKNTLFVALADAMLTQLECELDHRHQTTAEFGLRDVTELLSITDNASRDFYTVLFDLRSQGFLRDEYRVHANRLSAIIRAQLHTVCPSLSEQRVAVFAGVLIQRLESQLLHDDDTATALEAELQRRLTTE
ncbi:TetR/AcrR family transcriptional regulator [Haloferax sp. Atlit-6N]|uniref:TetR/AcrR family transcriptional regulator n=1 Tax=Haloferax sp. Atlit-6N TaxID=2077205 RepID=UPI001314878D|nr:TetR/AcrR family transcriptional regulator [Haloferax sp. Atlit-6N]